jgi:hypothetical protein
MGYGRAISKAVKQAGKQQQANTRGLSGNRNAQGDFMPEDVQIKGVQDSVTPDIQNYIDDVKAQIDEIDVMLKQEEVKFDASRNPDIDNGIPPADRFEAVRALQEEKAALLGDLIDKLSENGIPIPPQIQAIADDVYGEFDAVDDFSRSSQPGDEANAAWDEMGGNTL